MTATEIDFRGPRQKRLRRILGRSVRAALDGDVVGFALVTWDGRGDAHSSYCTESGPVGQRLMPAFVHDALQQHFSVSLAQEVGATRIDGDS